MTQAFDGNYCTGVFVPAAMVPALVTEVERRFAKRPPGATRYWAPLLRILRIAAAHGLAYWEATDLVVKQGHAEWLAAARATPQHSVAAKLGDAPSVFASDGDTLVASDLGAFATFVVDLTRWPPRIKKYPLFSYGARSRGPGASW
jgi:hypothetical protein